MKKIILGLMMCVASVGAFAQQQQKVVIGGKPYIVNISKDGEMTATPIEGNANSGPVQKKTALYGNTGTYIEGPISTYENGLPTAAVGGHSITGHDLTKPSRSYVDNYQTGIQLEGISQAQKLGHLFLLTLKYLFWTAFYLTLAGVIALISIHQLNKIKTERRKITFP